LGFKTLDTFLKSESGLGKLENFAISLCEGPFIGLYPSVCEGAVTEMADILIPVLADSFLSADYMCAYMLGLCSSPVYTPYYAQDYVDSILPTKPALIADNNYVNSLYDKIKADPNPRKTLKAI